MTRIKGRSKYLSNASKVMNSKRTTYKHENSHVSEDSSMRKGSSMRNQIHLYWEKRNKEKEIYVQSNIKRKIQREKDRSKRSNKSDV